MRKSMHEYYNVISDVYKRITEDPHNEAAFQAAMEYDGPYLIDTVIDRDEFVLPMLPPGGSMDDIITTRKQEEK